MSKKIKELVINGDVYVPKSSILQSCKSLDGLEFKIVRTYSAGVHAGYVAKRDGNITFLRNSIRLWYWKGAASLSQLSQEGVKNPDECKFGIPVIGDTELTETIEVIPVSVNAQRQIQSLATWRV